VNGAVLWTLNLLDARRNAVSEAFGNGLWVQNAFDPLTGLPTTRQAGTGGQSTNIQHLSYAWDPAGNLTSRQDLRQGLTESFTYASTGSPSPPAPARSRPRWPTMRSATCRARRAWAATPITRLDGTRSRAPAA